MLKSLLAVALGAAGALEGDKLLQRLKARYRPSALTGTLLDKINSRLEARRGAGAVRSGQEPGG